MNSCYCLLNSRSAICCFLAFDFALEFLHDLHPLFVVDLAIAVSIAVAEEVFKFASLQALANKSEGSLELFLVEHTIAVLIEPVEGVLEKLSEVLFEVFFALHRAQKLSLHEVEEVVLGHFSVVGVGELVHDGLELLRRWLLSQHAEDLVQLDGAQEAIGRLGREHFERGDALIADFLAKLSPVL